jgi:ABC-type bacteriocin/lantibiotic exporter with double-glycine peptidase domain
MVLWKRLGLEWLKVVFQNALRGTNNNSKETWYGMLLARMNHNWNISLFLCSVTDWLRY